MHACTGTHKPTPQTSLSQLGCHPASFTHATKVATQPHATCRHPSGVSFSNASAAAKTTITVLRAPPQTTMPLLLLPAQAPPTPPLATPSQSPYYQPSFLLQPVAVAAAAEGSQIDTQHGSFRPRQHRHSRVAHTVQLAAPLRAACVPCYDTMLLPSSMLLNLRTCEPAALAGAPLTTQATPSLSTTTQATPSLSRTLLLLPC
jgi:hypothetical protein